MPSPGFTSSPIGPSLSEKRITQAPHGVLLRLQGALGLLSCLSFCTNGFEKSNPKGNSPNHKRQECDGSGKRREPVAPHKLSKSVGGRRGPGQNRFMAQMTF